MPRNEITNSEWQVGLNTARKLTLSGKVDAGERHYWLHCNMGSINRWPPCLHPRLPGSRLALLSVRSASIIYTIFFLCSSEHLVCAQMSWPNHAVFAISCSFAHGSTGFILNVGQMNRHFFYRWDKSGIFSRLGSTFLKRKADVWQTHIWVAKLFALFAT